MSMTERNLAVLLTAKKFATSVAKPVQPQTRVKPASDGTREWLAFRMECVMLTNKKGGK
jgi:hypothetical protein